MEDNITITITGEGLSLTKKTTLQKAGQIISFLALEQTSPSSAGYDSSASALLPSSKPVQPKEIILSSAAKTYPQKIAALAVYMRDQIGQTSFTPQEIKVIFKKMGDEPRNFTRDLKVAIELQYVICVDSSTEQYEITDKGAEAVADSFSMRTARKATGSKRTHISNGIRDEVRQMQIVGTYDGLPDYHDLSTKGDKILWLLAYADKHGINSLTPTEADFISGELRDKVEAKGFTALNDRNVRNSYVAKTSTGFQIQKKGNDYLSSLVTS